MSAACLFAGLLAAGGCAPLSTSHRSLRLSADPPRARAIETNVAALADPRVRAEVRRHSVEIHPEFTMAFVEFDDQGRFWNRDELDLLERTLDSENARSDGAGLNVIVFAHVWRHGCDVCDSNVACFRAFLKQIQSDSLAGHRQSQDPTPAGTEIPYGRALLKCVRPIDPRDPLWVVRASDDVVRGHNGIFTTYLVDFVRRVIVEAGSRRTPVPPIS